MRRFISFEFLIIVVIAGLVAWVAIKNYTEKELSFEDILIENMKTLNEALNEYKALSGGILPSRLNIPVSAITKDTLSYFSVVGMIDPARGVDLQNDTTSLLYGRKLENPYNPRAIVAMTLEDTLEIKNSGVIYYLPEGIIGDRCMKCRIITSGRGDTKTEMRNYSDRF